MIEERDPEEQAIIDLDQMFRENALEEYEGAWETFKAYFHRVCEDNRKFRGLHNEGVKKSA